MPEPLNAKVVVTTKHRGVFFGTLESKTASTAVLLDARVCVYWSTETRGFVGLAAKGPMEGCRISDSCPRLELVDITSVINCTDEAIARWEEGPWTA